MIQLLAEATNDFTGQWFYVAFAAIGGAVGIVGIISFFATRREVDEIKQRLDKQDSATELMSKSIEDGYRRIDRSDEARISGIHIRLNPLETRAAKMEGQLEAFTMTFEKFTRIIEANGRADREQTSAFIQALNTFATVLADKQEKK